jgi:hypothetical protein
MGIAYISTGIVTDDEQVGSVTVNDIKYWPALFHETTYGPISVPDITFPPLKSQVNCAPGKAEPVYVIVAGVPRQALSTVNIAGEHIVTTTCCVTVVTHPFGNIAERTTSKVPPVVYVCIGLGTVLDGEPSPKFQVNKLPGGVVFVKDTGVFTITGDEGENVKLGSGAGITCITKLLFVAAEGVPLSTAVTEIV